jgi:hypothetical protein
MDQLVASVFQNGNRATPFRRQLIDASPCARVTPPGKAGARNRVLSDDDIAAKSHDDSGRDVESPFVFTTTLAGVRLPETCVRLVRGR